MKNIIFILLFLSIAGNVVADEFIQLKIFPENVGVFWQNKTQQFTCFGVRANGTKVNLTNQVDWYLEENPHRSQRHSAKETVKINENGLATVLKSWGRVQVCACYPKGCAPRVLPHLAAMNILLAPKLRQLSLNVNGGTVTSIPAGIHCGVGFNDCSEQLLTGKNILLHATPDNGYVHGTWGGDCSGSTATDCNITIQENSNVVANFNITDPRTLSITPPIIGGTITSNPAGIHCGGGFNDCSKNFPVNRSISLIATPTIGYYVHGTWGGDCSGSTATNCNVNLTNNSTVIANFQTNPNTELTVIIETNDTANGIVASIPAGINCASVDYTDNDCIETYYDGTVISLTAYPIGGSLHEWTGDCTVSPSNSNVATVTMNGAKTCTAVFH